MIRIVPDGFSRSAVSSASLASRSEKAGASVSSSRSPASVGGRFAWSAAAAEGPAGFQPADDLAEAGLRHSEPGRRAGEGALLGHREKRRQVGHLVTLHL